MRLENYKRQLLSDVLCINMDLQGSFKTGMMSPDNSSATDLSSDLSSEGLTMHTGCLNLPNDANSGTTSSC